MIQAPFEAVLFHGALEFAQELMAAIGHGARHADDRVIFFLAGGVEAVLPLAAFELLLAVHVAQIVQRIADDRDVDTADLGGFECILDRGRRRALAGTDVLMKARGR